MAPVVENMEILSGRKHVLAGDLLCFEAGAVPECLRGPETVGIETESRAGAAGPSASVAKVQRCRAVGVARLNANWSTKGAALVSELQHVACFYIQTVGGGRTEDRGVV